MKNKKKIFGIAILTILGLVFCGSVFGVLFWATYIRVGISVGLSILISLSPFIGAALVGGVLKIGMDLAFTESDDSNHKGTDRNNRRNNKRKDG